MILIQTYKYRNMYKSKQFEQLSAKKSKMIYINFMKGSRIFILSDQNK